MEETRTQIKFESPDIDDSPRPQLIILEQEEPIEGTSKNENGEEFLWHKWLCTNNGYFMASTALDGMLKLIPNKVGKVIKIEKVPNPKGGYPYFQVNGMNKDQIITHHNAGLKVAETFDADPAMPAQPTPVKPVEKDGTMARIESKIDKLIKMLDNSELPF